MISRRARPSGGIHGKPTSSDGRHRLPGCGRPPGLLAHPRAGLSPKATAPSTLERGCALERAGHRPPSLLSGFGYPLGQGASN